MPCYAPNKITYSRTEDAFIKEYYGKIPNTDILKQLNTMRTDTLKMSALRHHMRQLKLIKGIRLIHWSEEQTDFLLKNYQAMGNIELARKLNKMKATKRKFTTKNIWKKMLLLNIKRTDAELTSIRENHKKAGHYPGKVDAYPQGHIKVNIVSGVPHPHIKKGKFFVKLVREQWKERHGEIPPGMMIHFKDLDTLNLKESNLVLKQVGDLSKEDRKIMMRTARANIEKLNQPEPIVKEYQRGTMADLSKQIKVVINSKTTIYVKPGTNIDAVRAKYTVPGIKPKDEMEKKMGYTYQF